MVKITEKTTHSTPNFSPRPMQYHWVNSATSLQSTRGGGAPCGMPQHSCLVLEPLAMENTRLCYEDRKAIMVVMYMKEPVVRRIETSRVLSWCVGTDRFEQKRTRRKEFCLMKYMSTQDRP